MLSLVFLPAIVLFCLGAVTDIGLPGIYMDAVNPDYAVVGVLNPGGHLQTWFLPGVLLFGRWPVLGQIYHGAVPFYVGLPFYALFGTGVVGIRLTNMIFGCIVIIAAGVFLRAVSVRALIASLCLMLLALDPAFLFSFRTQFYITLLPIAFVFCSAALVEMRADAPPRAFVFLAGLCAGLACYGYFIYFFLVPALALLALYRWHTQSRMRLCLWPLGFCLGVAPYLIGVIAMLIATGGLHGFLAFLRDYLHSLNVQRSSLTLMQRVPYFYFLLRGSILDLGPGLMMLHAAVPIALPVWKMVLLLLVPALAILSGLTRPGRITGLLFVLGLVIGFCVLVLVFGSRLWLHHAAMLVPLLYVALALALERIASFLRPAAAARALCLVIVAPFLVTNASDRQAVFLQLETTGGVALASDAIDRFAVDALREKAGTQMFFPDWGVFMSFAMLTRGTIPYATTFSVAAARATLCGGKDAEVVTMVAGDGDRPAKWSAALAWPSVTTLYRQRDGVPVLVATRWRAADRPAGACS